MGQQSCPERYNNLQVAHVAHRKARTGALLPDSIAPGPPRHLCIPLSAQVWALKKTAISQSILSDKRFLETMFPILAFCSSLSFQNYRNVQMAGACVGHKDEDTHIPTSLCHPDGFLLIQEGLSSVFIHKCLFVPGGLPVTYSSTSPQALRITTLLKGTFQTMNFFPSIF